MKLGVFNCVVVSSEEDLREVLITKSDHFDGRPDWRRFDLMFGGTRRNGRFSFISQFIFILYRIFQQNISNNFDIHSHVGVAH